MRVSGLILVRQRPGTATGICFITIEDETGIANLVIFPKLFEKYRREIVASSLLMVEGKLQKEGEVTHVIVTRCYDKSPLLRELNMPSLDESVVRTLSRADEHPSEDYKHKDKRTQPGKAIQSEIFPAARSFK